MSPQAFLGALVLVFVLGAVPPARAAAAPAEPADVVAEEAVAVTATPNAAPAQNPGPGSAIYNPLVPGSTAPVPAPVAPPDDSRTGNLMWASALAVLGACGLLAWRARRMR